MVNSDFVNPYGSTMVYTPSGVPSTNPHKNTERILTEQAPQKKRPHGAGGTGSDPRTGTTCSAYAQRTEQNFPPAYYSVRKMRYNSMPSIDLLSVTGNAKEGSGSGPGKRAAGFEIAGDERQYTIKNFHIPAYKRNVSSSISNDGGQLECVSCQYRHALTSTDPVCLILSDQNFPPALPTLAGQCCIIIRVEDAMLSKMPGLLKE
jgi:hypothetical protein